MKQVYCWEFEYWDNNTQDYNECTYYTYGDERQIAVEAFQEDEPQVKNDWSVTLDEVLSEEKFLNVYSVDLILNRE